MRSANEKKMFELLLEEIEDTLHEIEQRCLTLESSDQAKELQVIFRAAHNVKGAAQLYGLNDFGLLVHSFEEILTTLQKAQRPVTNQSIDVLLSAQSFFKDWVQKLRTDETFIPPALAQTKAFLIQHVEDLKQDKIGAKEANAPNQAPPVQQSQAPASFPPDTQRAADNDQAPQRQRRNTGSLRVPSQKIDGIMQLIGELSIQQGILLHNLQSNTLNAVTCANAVQLNQKNLKDLYQLILSIRMQPIDTLFQRIERTARDIAREQNKNVDIRMVGADTPVDKTVIELITDPLMHLTRNAIDHGIEDNETRSKLGKPVTATLTIKTQQDAGRIYISVSDDGRGLDPQIILEKAIRKGLVPPGKRMKDADIIQLIFLPGFSTRDEVTHISGRGIGMDIVQKAIQSLGGDIEIKSKKSQGTTFQIGLPASLEIIDGLIIRVANQRFVIPRQDVEEILDFDAYEIEKFGRAGTAIRVRKAIVPVENLIDYVGMNVVEQSGQSSAKSDSRAPVALLVRLQDRTQLALRVDTVITQQKIVVRPLPDHLARAPGFTGVTVLGDGEPAMILSGAQIGESYVKWIEEDVERGKEPA